MRDYIIYNMYKYVFVCLRCSQSSFFYFNQIFCDFSSGNGKRSLLNLKYLCSYINTYIRMYVHNLKYNNFRVQINLEMWLPFALRDKIQIPFAADLKQIAPTT